jgi:hypothetical protein
MTFFNDSFDQTEQETLKSQMKKEIAAILALTTILSGTPTVFG